VLPPVCTRLCAYRPSQSLRNYEQSRAKVERLMAHGPVRMLPGISEPAYRDPQACLDCLLLLVQSSPSPHEIIARFSISSALACPTRDCSVLMTCPSFAKLSASLSLPWTFLEYTFFSVTRVSSCWAERAVHWQIVNDRPRNGLTRIRQRPWRLAPKGAAG